MPKLRKGKHSSSTSLVVAAPASAAAGVLHRTRSDGLVAVAAVLVKKKSSLRPEETDDEKLAKKFNSGLQLDESENRKLRKLQNITNFVDPETPAVKVEPKKRKLVPDDGGPQQNSDARKRVKSDEPKRSGEGDAEADVIADSHDKLKEALGKHYFDARNRLNLDYLPSCLRNVKKCAVKHAKRVNQAKRIDHHRQRDAKELLIENRPVQFLERLDQALIRREFIDASLFVRTLELILTINQPSAQLNADYDARSVLEHSVTMLDRTVEEFPPCWLDLKAAYQNIIFGNLEEDCFSRYDRSEGLFKVVLFLLESTITESNAVAVTRTSSNDRSLANFYLWEQENNQKYDYGMLSREEKLERLFLVMGILVKILELDLSMWILRHPHKIAENLAINTRKPLVVSLLWHDHSMVGAFNSLIGRIIRLYVDVVALEYPQEDIRVLSRFLSVIGTAINLSEIQYDGTVNYPCIKNNTHYFVRQIARTIEKSNHHNRVSLYLRSIQQMRSPLIRMVLVDEFLLKLDNNKPDISPSATSYMKHLVKGHWMNYNPGDNSAEHSPKPARRYPFLDVDRQQNRRLPPPAEPESSEINRAEYVSLLLQGFRAYMEVFPLQNYFCSLKHSTKDKSPTPSAYASRSPSQSPKRIPFDKLKKHRYDFGALGKNINKLERQRKPTRVIVRSVEDRPKANGTTADAGRAALVLDEVNVTSELQLYYREEVKHLLLIRKWLRLKTLAVGQDEEYELFEHWRNYLATVDETLACGERECA